MARLNNGKWVLLFWAQIVSKTTGNRGWLIQSSFHATLTCQNVIIRLISSHLCFKNGGKQIELPLTKTEPTTCGQYYRCYTKAASNRLGKIVFLVMAGALELLPSKLPHQSHAGRI